MSPLKKYHVEWDCPHCGNSHNWWWEDEFEAFAEDESDMLCDRCDTLVRCVGDGHGFYAPVKPKDDHTRLLELEERLSAVHSQCFDAINRLSKRLLKLETQYIEPAKGKEQDEYRPPEKGDMWVSDDDPTVMKIFTGGGWLPVQQEEL